MCPTRPRSKTYPVNSLLWVLLYRSPSSKDYLPAPLCCSAAPPARTTAVPCACAAKCRTVSASRSASPCSPPAPAGQSDLNQRLNGLVCLEPQQVFLEERQSGIEIAS